MASKSLANADFWVNYSFKQIILHCSYRNTVPDMTKQTHKEHRSNNRGSVLHRVDNVHQCRVSLGNYSSSLCILSCILLTLSKRLLC